MSAIRSVESQSIGRDRIQLIIVNDGVEATPPEVRNLADLVIETGGRRGGGYARNAGVDAANGDYVAFLDDDDTWVPTKLAAQLGIAERERLPIIVSARVQQVRADGPSGSAVVVPARVIRRGERVEDYLFRGRSPSRRRQSLFTSTLLTSTAFAREIRWDETLRRHQDWDWLCRAALAGARIVQLPTPLTIYSVGSSGSISAKADWKSSLAWAQQYVGKWDPQTMVDFLAGQSFRYALQARSMKGVQAVARQIVQQRKLPSVNTIAIGLAGVLPRRNLERFLVPLAGRRRSSTTS